MKDAHRRIKLEEKPPRVLHLQNAYLSLPYPSLLHTTLSLYCTDLRNVHHRLLDVYRYLMRLSSCAS